jgi:hypothetical protein
MLFLITNIVLDITFGTLWWTTKNTGYLLYNGAIYLKDSLYENNNNTLDLKSKDNFIIMSLEEYDNLKKINLHQN